MLSTKGYATHAAQENLKLFSRMLKSDVKYRFVIDMATL